ncbi:uncharacterized protein [Maniola hyperantus]|uniref:uncharacterized protein n=1 Tax=Aphantopus hyperantus TaxID=2795564 RepID=UPI001568A7A6|nr:uncharacterized protein LOC117983971 [Maniola hyperantus]
MSHMKKTVPSKFIADEFDKILTDSKFINDSPKKKKPADTATVENPNLSITNPTNAKKKKINEGIEACGESRQKALKVINRQLEARRLVNENMLKKLSDAVKDFQADYNALKENEQKLEHLTGSFMKCMQHTITAYKQKLKSFEELHATFKKRYEDTDAEQRGEINKLGRELEEDISKLKEKLILETKRSEWENLQKYFMKSMQSKF